MITKLKNQKIRKYQIQEYKVLFLQKIQRPWGGKRPRVNCLYTIKVQMPVVEKMIKKQSVTVLYVASFFILWNLIAQSKSHNGAIYKSWHAGLSTCLTKIKNVFYPGCLFFMLLDSLTWIREKSFSRRKFGWSCIQIS